MIQYGIELDLFKYTDDSALDFSSDPMSMLACSGYVRAAYQVMPTATPRDDRHQKEIDIIGDVDRDIFAVDGTRHLCPFAGSSPAGPPNRSRRKVS